MIYGNAKLLQWIETYDKYGRPTAYYEEIKNITLCLNHRSIDNAEGEQVYHITLPTGICNEPLLLEEPSKYRIEYNGNLYDVLSHNVSRRYTVFNLRGVYD